MDMNAQKTGKQAYNGATKAVDHLGAEVKSGANQVANQAADKFSEMETSLTERYQDLRKSAGEGYDVAVDTVKKYPLYAILGATGIGLLGGLLLARRRN